MLGILQEGEEGEGGEEVKALENAVEGMDNSLRQEREASSRG